MPNLLSTADGLYVAARADVHADGLHLPANERSDMPEPDVPAEEPFTSNSPQHCSGDGGAMTAIADLVALLLSAGISAESVSAAVDLAQRHANEQVEIHGKSAEPPQNSAETPYERRLRKDRERKRNSAETKKPPLILTSSLTESKKLPEEEVKKERRTREKKRLGPLPENWLPPDNAYVLATECGTTVSTVEPVFRDYLKSSGKQYADHDAAFCNFVRNQNKFNGNRNGKNDGRRTVHDAAKDLLAKVRSFDAEPPSGICGGTGGPDVRLLSQG